MAGEGLDPRSGKGRRSQKLLQRPLSAVYICTAVLRVVGRLPIDSCFSSLLARRVGHSPPEAARGSFRLELNQNRLPMVTLNEGR